MDLKMTEFFFPFIEERDVWNWIKSERIKFWFEERGGETAYDESG